MQKGTEEDPLIALAKKAVEEYVRFGRKIGAPSTVPPELAAMAGAFVCLKRDGQLRGCIGTIEPCETNLAAEIINNSISSATRDPRFQPVSKRELDGLQYTVDVMGKPERIRSLDELDVKTYGVIVESGSKRGLLLPDLEGVDTVEDQVDIAMRKAGIRDGEPLKLYRFEVKRHGE